MDYMKELSYQEHKSMIKSGLNRIVEDFIEIGYHLKQVRDRQLFREDGYENINEFAKNEYGLSQSNTSRFISITECYSIDGNSPKLLPEFEGYGSSKLSEMLSLTPEEMKLVSIRTTVAEIRTLKEAKKEAELNEYSDNYATSHKAESLDNTQSNVNYQEEINTTLPEGKLLITEFFRDISKRDMLKQLAILLSEGTSRGSVSEAVSEIVNPSGHLTFKKGVHFLAFTEEQIKYSRFAGNTAEFTYLDLLNDIALTFNMAADDPWTELYGEPEPEPEPKAIEKPKAETPKKKDKPVNKNESTKIEKQSLKAPEEDHIPGQAIVEDHPKLLPEENNNQKKCRVCGCTDDRACEGGCYWVEEDLCSACESKKKVPSEDIEVVEADIIGTTKPLEAAVVSECEYCREEFPKNLVTENYFLAITTDGYIKIHPKSNPMAKTVEKTKINACPMCRRQFE